MKILKVIVLTYFKLKLLTGHYLKNIFLNHLNYLSIVKFVLYIQNVLILVELFKKTLSFFIFFLKDSVYNRPINK